MDQVLSLSRESEANGCPGIDCGVPRYRGSSGRCAGPAFQRQRRFQCRWPRRQGGGGVPGTGQVRIGFVRTIASSKAHHGESRAGGHAEGRQPLRFADRFGRHGGDRRDSFRRARRFYGPRRVGSGWLDQPGGWGLASRGRCKRSRPGFDLPGGVRAGSRMGLRRHSDRRSPIAHPVGEPFQRNASSFATGACDS